MKNTTQHQKQNNYAIICRGGVFGMLYGAFVKNTEIHSVVYEAIKAGRATKLVDTEYTLMYKID